MREFAANLATRLASGTPVALATVVKTTGSTPRGPGARMVIRRDGRHLGTVGGGCGEAQVVAAGLMALDDGKARLVRVDLTDAVTEDSDGACGGAMEVVVVPGGRDLLPLFRVLENSGSQRSGMRLVTCLAPARILGAMLAGSDAPLAGVGLADRETEQLWAALTAAADDFPVSAPAHGPRARLLEMPVAGESWSVLCEEIGARPRLLVCGGGHIAVPLSRLGRLLDWEVVILDDRQMFANHARFPEADQVICGPFRPALEGLAVDANTCAAVVTRGHRDDLECVRSLLGRRPGYLGMIGSRRRVVGVRKLLVEEGFDVSLLDKLHAPVGLDIGAETPEEIAVAIMAEMIMARRGGTGRSLKLRAPGMGAVRA